MKKSFLMLLFVALALPVLISRGAFADEWQAGNTAADLHHPPQTDAERALDYVLRLDAAQGDLFLAMDTFLPEKSPNAVNAARYAQLFTHRLAQTVYDKDLKLYQQYCGNGKDSTIGCQRNYDALFCAQIFPENVLYRTIGINTQGYNEAIIGYSSGPHDKDIALYKMIFDTAAHQWKIDDIECVSGR